MKTGKTKGVTMKTGKTIGIILLIAGAAVSVQATLIAYEGFLNTAATNDYAAVALGNALPVVVGNSGFDSANTWGGPTSSIQADAGSLSHSRLVQSAQSGQILLYSGTLGRGSSRSLAATPTVSATYYMSGLVNLASAGRLAAGEYRAVGFMGTNVNGISTFTNGMNYGVRNVAGSIYLAAFAGGTIYNVAALPAFATTYQVVLKLDVNATGNETLSAWYAASGDTKLNDGFSGVSVETWSKAADLSRLSTQISSGTAYAAGTGTGFDEVYLGTKLSDVTTAAIPEPTTLGLFVVSFAGLMVFRRALVN
jgi:hypothetical protein